MRSSSSPGAIAPAASEVLITPEPGEGSGKNGTTLLHWLLRRYPATPKSRAKQWILAGRVSVAGAVLRKPHEVLRDPGAALELRDRHETTLDCGAGWQIHPRVSLLYLDSALGIVNKGPGLISVPAAAGDLSALSISADFLAGKLRARERGVAGRSLPPVYRRLEPLPVHRLDQYTSGVFCIAMNPAARGNLIEQLKAHTMEREYVAYVEGRPAAPRGTWRQWLQLSKDELRQQVLSPAQVKEVLKESTTDYADAGKRGRGGSAGASPHRQKGDTREGGRLGETFLSLDSHRKGGEAREAITHFEVIGEFVLAGGKGVVSKLRLRLETGRKHQIRAQAAYAGVPLIGDRTYNPRYRGRDAANPPIDFPRQALHAEVLKLEHPERPGKRMSWRAELPKDLRQLEADLRAGRI